MEMTSEKIQFINDYLRNCLCTSEYIEDGGAFRVRGKLLLSCSVNALSTEQQIELVNAVQEFGTFTERNDPHGEHDFGAIDLFGSRWFWKFDYYDNAFESFGHDWHTLLIMAADEY